MLERVAKMEGRLQVLQISSTGNSRTLNMLRRAGYVKVTDHPTVKHGKWPADALSITDDGQRALAGAAPRSSAARAQIQEERMATDREVMRRVQSSLSGVPLSSSGGVSDVEADAGGQALRERQMAGRITRPWSDVPRSERKKWVETARVVIAAAKAAQR